MEMRRYKDIMAIKEQGKSPVAFHARNLEVAEITEELWDSMQGPTINNEIIHWELEENPEVMGGKLGFNVKSLTINVTQICNLKCEYCAAGGDGTYGDPKTKISIEKTLPQIKFFIDQLKPESHFHISFLGGEPMLYPDLIRAIAEYTQELGTQKKLKLSFKITTNGTLFTEKALFQLASFKPEIVISLDGGKEIQDLYRPSKNNQSSFDEIIKGLQLVQKNRKHIGRLALHGVFHKKYVDLVSTYKLFASLNVDWFEFTYAVAEDDVDSNVEYVEQMRNIAQLAYQTGGEAALRKIQNYNHYFNLLDSQKRLENHCGAGKSFFVIDAKNKIYTCPWLVGKPEEVVGEGSDLNYDKLQFYQDSLVVKNNCESCWARYLCGGGCMFVHESKTGKKNIKNSQFCDRTKQIIATTISYYENCRRQKEYVDNIELNEKNVEKVG